MADSNKVVTDPCMAGANPSIHGVSRLIPCTIPATGMYKRRGGRCEECDLGAKDDIMTLFAAMTFDNE